MFLMTLQAKKKSPAEAGQGKSLFRSLFQKLNKQVQKFNTAE